MVRKTLVLLCWFPLTFTLLFVNLSLLVSLSHKAEAALDINNLPVLQISASSFATEQVLGASIRAGDARGLLIQNFLMSYESPMAPYADLIVSKSDEQGIDFRMVVAIAMCESGLGKRMPSKDSFNPFGIAVYTGQNFGKKFDSWEHSISWVTEYIRSKYYDRGILDLKDIGAIWAPPSVENGYSWTNCVKHFINSIH